MPIADISLRAGKPEAYRQAIFNSFYRAMREALNVPEDDQFMSQTRRFPTRRHHDCSDREFKSRLVAWPGHRRCRSCQSDRIAAGANAL
jgi:hypothetical protein